MSITPRSLPLYTIYSLRSESSSIERMQQASLSSEHVGLRQTHGLIGSAEWWANIEAGTLPLIKVHGRVAQFWPGHHGDYPEFELVDETGSRSRWGCNVPAGTAQIRFQPGTQVEVSFVRQELKVPFDGTTTVPVVVEIRGA